MDDMNQTPQPTKVTLVDENRIPEETDSQEFDLPEAESDLPEPSTPTMAFPSFEFRQDQPSHLEQPPLCYPQLEKPLMKSTLSKRHFSPSTGKTPRGEKEAVGELLMILVDCMEELNTRSRETLLRKFFSEIERDERLEKFIVERLSQSKVKAISDLCEQLPSSVREKISDSGSVKSSGSIEEDPEASSPDDGDQIPSSDADAGFSGSFDTYYGTSGTSERSLIETVEDLSQELERFKVRTLELGGIGQEAQEEGKK
ncbi:hypothetical protein RHGRI_007050 [Rhododendron griersonianum]|uniref:Uncharacterized protein n=1 Tax=Rhododendron griersonianum TaxID=479676 RepID=A0AAV6KVJ7_9ERIC|nr:hypothetical protein RHGRI_007050 [Rhododendron griersonianum]